MSSCQRFLIIGIALVLFFSLGSGCVPDLKGGMYNCLTGKTIACPTMSSKAKKAKSLVPSSQKPEETDTSSIATTTVSKPVIRTFAASPAEVTAGDKTTLEWHTSWATTITIEPDIGTVKAAGSKILTPEKDTTYTITATNASGKVEKTVNITVSASTGSPEIAELPPSDHPSSHQYTPPAGAPALTEPGGSEPSDSPFPIEPSSVPPPHISFFTATPSSISAGSCTSLSWLISGASSARISPGGSVPSSGNAQSCPGSTITYTLIASNSSGSVQRTLTVYVSAPAPPPVPVTPPTPVPTPTPVPVTPTPPTPTPTPTPPPPTPTPATKPLLYFSANPVSVAAGSCSTLTWTATNATSVIMSPGGTVAASGSVQACPSSTTTYNVTATNAAGSVTLPVTVTVTAAPPPTPPPPADTAGCEQSLFNAVNARRAGDGKAALTRNSYIDGLCRQHAQYVANQNALSHDNVDSRYAAIYANVPGIHACAENVLQAWMPCDATAMATQWFNSPGHKTNMLNAAYTVSGMGIVIDANGKIWACQLFAGP